MVGSRIRRSVLLTLMILGPSGALGALPEAAGPLRLHPDNPRYVAVPSGPVVWLTGSHTWANLQDRGVEGQTPDFDYEGYLDFLGRHGHNFIRLWAWEHAQWMQFVAKDVPVRHKPRDRPA